jgi:DNA-directed RNA polymerase delta subunit
MHTFLEDNYDFVYLSEILWRYNQNYPEDEITKESLAMTLKHFKKLGLVDHARGLARTEGAWRLRKNAEPHFSSLPVPENKILFAGE